MLEYQHILIDKINYITLDTDTYAGRPLVKFYFKTYCIKSFYFECGNNLANCASNQIFLKTKECHIDRGQTTYSEKNKHMQSYKI